MSGLILKAVLRPFGSLFFGDGQPFEQSDQGQAIGRSIFPPLPSTTSGLVRLAIARALGVDAGDWTQTPEVHALLGAGDQLGQVRFEGPFLKDEEDRYALPWPLDLREPSSTWVSDLDELDYLAAAEETPARIATDLDVTVLPGAAQGPKCLDFCDQATFETYLDTAPIRRSEVRGFAAPIREWQSGITRDTGTRQVKEDRLYSQARTRLPDEVELVVLIHHLPDDVIQKLTSAASARAMPLGGDGGLCELAFSTVAAHELPCSHGSLDAPAGKHFRLVLMTPALLPELPTAGMSTLEITRGGLEATLAFAIAERPIIAGRWRGRAGRAEGQRAARQILLAAGSVLFVETPREQSLKELLGLAVGERTDWGFGKVAVARNQRVSE